MTAADVHVRSGNPYVGPASFRAGDRLYGRARALTDLRNLLVADRIVLLYSPSGAGKTSLIQAALVAALEEDGFEVLPIVRVTHTVVPARSLPDTANRYVLSTLLSLEENVPPEQQQPLDELVGLTLAEYLARRPNLDAVEDNEVLVFDQFEEVLTADPTDDAAKREFFVQLGELLQDRKHWALFAMREDYLAALEPYLRHIPTGFRTRFRLDLLTPDQAVEAVVRPAADAGVEFAPEAARRLVDDLRRVRVQHPDGTTEALGQHVEPVQLQLACHLLWSRLPAGTERIDDVLGAERGDVEEALAAYYGGRVHAVAERTGTREATIREWFEDHLITPQGLRGQVLDGPLEDPAADRVLLSELMDAHLVRAESRRQATWYELSHDRFIEPVRRDNAAWRLEHMSEFERAAMLWDSERRPDRLLLTGTVLASAVAGLDPANLGPRENDFLVASRAADQRANDAVRSAVRVRRLAWALGAVCVLSVGLAVFSGVKGAEAGRARDAAGATIVHQNALIAASREIGYDQDRAAGLAVAVAEDGLDAGARTVLSLVANSSDVSEVLRGTTEPQTLVEVSADGGTVVAGGDGEINVWGRPGPGEPTVLLAETDGELADLAVSEDGATVAAGYDDGQVVVWDAQTGEERAAWHEPTGMVWALAMSPDGSRVALVGDDDAASLWDASDGTLVADIGEPDEYAWDVAFSPDGASVAAATDGTGILLRDAATGAARSTVVTEGANQQLRIGPGADAIATVGESGAVATWDVETGARLTLQQPAVSQRVMDVSQDLTTALIAASPGLLQVVAMDDGHVVARTALPGADVLSARFDGSGHVVVATHDGAPAVLRARLSASWNAWAGRGEQQLVAWDDGTVRSSGPDDDVQTTVLENVAVDDLDVDASGAVALVLAEGDATVWDLDRGAAERTLGDDDRWLVSVSLSGDGTRAAGVDDEGTITVWDVASGDVVADLDPEWDAIRYANLDPTGRRVLVLPGLDPATREPADAAAWIGDVSGSADWIPLELPAAGEDAMVRAAAPQVGAAGGDDGGQDLGAAAPQTGAPGGTEPLQRLPVAPQTVAPTEKTDRATATGDEWAIWDPTGTQVAMSTQDGRVAAFDAATGEPAWSIDAHQSRAVVDLKYAAEGRIVSTGNDRRVVVLDAEDGEPLHVAQLLEYAIAATTTPDGSAVLATTQDATVITVPFDDEALVAAVRDRITRPLSATDCEDYGLDC